MSSNESDRLSHISNGSYQSGEPNNFPESADLNSWVDEKSDNPYSVNFRLGVWNISGLKSKLHEHNESFDTFVNTFDIIGFVETWADENDMFQIDGFLEPFVSIRDKHPHAWRNSGGIAVFIEEALSKYC